MRLFYIILAIIFTSVSFVFAMENMWLRAPAMFMFFKGTYTIGMLLLVMMILSLVGGFFFGLYMSSHRDDDSESGDDIFN